MGDVTTLLSRWNAGDGEALKELIAEVHAELRGLASGLLRHERPDHTLQPTELVHELYLRMAGLTEMPFSGRAHFYGAVAEGMRRILVDHSRRRNAGKRGGPHLHEVPLEDVLNLPIDLRVNFERLNDVLSELATLDPVKARVVTLRYFAGLSIGEIAELLEVSPATVRRHWAFSRTWLYQALGG